MGTELGVGCAGSTRSMLTSSRIPWGLSMTMVLSPILMTGYGIFPLARVCDCVRVFLMFFRCGGRRNRLI